MNAYLEFVDQLDQHLQGYHTAPRASWVKDGLRFVNGLAAEELRRLVDLDTRREFGAFFTDSELAFRLISTSELDLSGNCAVYDPAMGAGNLLIAAATASLLAKGKVRLLGTDLHEEFVRAATLRLSITGLLTDGQQSAPETGLLVGDGLQDNKYYKSATHVITNPPFNLIDGDESINWGKGKLSAAAVFIDRIIRYVKPGTPILAILPDVLRSGSRYDKWRRMVEANCTITKLSKLGQFDKFADVDVFSVVLTKRTAPDELQEMNIWTSYTHAEEVIGDRFNVSVGNVVDNRDLHEGPLRPFLASRGLAGWKVVQEIARQRRFKGRALAGPFVVIKRTSRRGDQHRAVASIVALKEPVYVDNHLIVLQPKSGKLQDCHDLILQLRLPATSDWIDEQIRCRHLTVKVVTCIPL